MTNTFVIKIVFGFIFERIKLYKLISMDGLIVSGLGLVVLLII